MTVVTLPRLLDPATGGKRRIEVDGDTVGQVVETLNSDVPGLTVHLFDHNGNLRDHVLCFVDGVASRLKDPGQPVVGEVRFLQAVSGG